MVAMTRVLPNRSALTGWLRNAGLEPESIYQQDAGNGRRRVGGKARKMRGEAFLEHGLVGRRAAIEARSTFETRSPLQGPEKLRVKSS